MSQHNCLLCLLYHSIEQHVVCKPDVFHLSISTVIFERGIKIRQIIIYWKDNLHIIVYTTECLPATNTSPTYTWESCDLIQSGDKTVQGYSRVPRGVIVSYAQSLQPTHVRLPQHTTQYGCCWYQCIFWHLILEFQYFQYMELLTNLQYYVANI